MRLPDFIIVGAMKCGTSTLHDQLAQQPGILMSTPKEPCFFSEDAQWRKGLAWYSSLFASAPHDALCGESSTHYTKLPTHPHTIRRMLRVLPAQVRFIYMMRHPTDRLISHYIHDWTERKISVPVESALAAHQELIAFSKYGMQLQPLLDAFGNDRVLPMFLERMSQHPQEELERVCRFIGYPQRPQWCNQVNNQNVSSDRLRKSALRDALVHAPGLRDFRRAFIPKPWRDRVKSFWTLKERPSLSISSKARLKDIFDRDLAIVGEWLGVDLCCDTFQEVATATIPQWKESKEVAAL